MKILIPCAIVILATGFGTGLVIGTPPAVLEPVAGKLAISADQSDKIKELREKRIAVLKELVAVSEQAYKGGSFGFDQLIKARLDLLQAQLDASQNKEERIRLLEEMVKQAETLDEAVKKQFEAKQATRIDALKANAFVLQTQIALEQAKVAQGP